jgi:hypothetical protein
MLVEILRPYCQFRPGRVIDVTEGVADALARTRIARPVPPPEPAAEPPEPPPPAPPEPPSPPTAKKKGK